MNADTIADALEWAREEHILDAGAPARRRPLRAALAAAACVALVIGGLALSGVLRGPGDHALSERSRGVRVYNVRGSAFDREYCLIPLTEEEIFTKWDTVIFRGVVTDIQNLDADMNGQTYPFSVVSVEVSRVLRGGLAPGDTARFLVDVHIGDAAYATAHEGAANIRLGTEGIFMPMVLDGESMFGANGAWLCLRDLAPYQLPDGVRWTFLMTDSGLAYDRPSYPALPNARTLEEVEEFIRGMLES